MGHFFAFRSGAESYYYACVAMDRVSMQIGFPRFALPSHRPSSPIFKLPPVSTRLSRRRLIDNINFNLFTSGVAISSFWVNLYIVFFDECSVLVASAHVSSFFCISCSLGGASALHDRQKDYLQRVGDWWVCAILYVSVLVLYGALFHSLGSIRRGPVGDSRDV